MAVYKNNKTLVAIIIFLLVTNVAMLAFLFFNKPEHRDSASENKGKFSAALKEDVGFSKNQMEKYQALRKTQLDNVKSYFDEVRKAKIELYDLLQTVPVADSTVSSVANQVGEKQKALDLHIFHHFQRVRAICSPGQLPEFDSAMKKLVVRMISRKDKK